MILIYVLVNTIFCYLGMTEAWGYSAQTFRVKNIKKNTLVPLRALILIAVIISACFVEISAISGVILSLSLVFSFSFFHNGFYEIQDDKIKETYVSFWKSFKHISKNDSSRLSYDFASRLWMFVFSVMLLIAAIFINN